MYTTRRSQFPRRLMALVTAFCLILPLLPAFEQPVRASAESDAAMDQLQQWGIITGYPDGQTHPERELTRAEYVAMVNRAYGYKNSGATPFEDVPATSWYADDIGIGYNAGYFKGISATEAGPNNTLTREQAIVMLGRNMRFDEVPGEVTEFADGHDFSSWSHGLSRAAAQHGIIGGYSDGTFRPKNNITRGEMAIMLRRALGELINQPGVHTLSDHYGSVTISSPNTILKDSTIAGDLYITGGLELGDITLDNVRVLGDIIVAGGGESQNGNESIILRNVEADKLLVDSMADQYVSLRAEGNTVISEAELRSDAYVQDRTRPGDGLLNITLDSPDPNASFTLSGNLENVVNKTPNSRLNIAMGTVSELTVDEHARDSVLNLDVNSMVTRLNLDTATHVTGVGDIDKLIVNAPGCEVDMLPDSITIRPGLVATIAGEEMDAVKALESSADPRLLAGYPKLKNIAPTSATALFSTNKTGTVYWAVSSTTNGSIPEDELIDPTEGNTRIALSGTTAAPNANEEISAALASLEPDSAYYLSAVLTDAHDRHSPVKVASFKTPDNTVPAFAQGYPQVTQNDFTLVTKIVEDEEKEVPEFHVQVAAMPNKDCQLYYALYPQGSVAPTGQQFRTGSLGKPVQSGVEDVTKNVVEFIDFYKLDELTTYDLYLWLTDADGRLSSQVQKLTFTTVDGTPPEFQFETPLVSDIAANSVRLTVNVSEQATVYWVAVLHGTNYIKDSEHWSESAKRQIESGTNGVARGSVNVRKDTDAVITVGGLKPATNYDIYYVAKDTAGNYSRVVKEDPSTYMLQTNTLDTEPPTATQEFTRYPEGNEITPYANTDVYIVFSEDVMQYTPNQSRAQNEYVTLDTLYDAVKNAQTADEKAAAKAALGSALRSMIKLYNAASTGVSTVPDRALPGNESNWVIDYREARVERHPETNTMMVVFPSTTDESGNGPALNLSSGATYYFVLDDIADTSSSRNRMGRTTLPRFTTISAQVTLSPIEVTSIKGKDENDNDINIPIDIAFSMTPVSTNVEDSVNWDMLFWSDTTVAFEVYELSGNNNQTATNNKLVVNAETGAPATARVLIDRGDSFLGRSLFRNLYALDRNPSVTGRGNRMSDSGSEYVNSEWDESGYMTDGKPKYYGIHFTEVKYTPEDSRARPTGDASKNWDAKISFRVSVVTGSSADLGNLASLNRITESVMTDYITNWNVTEIHTPNPFTRQKEFSDQSAPGFYTGFPQIVPTDTTARITVSLERPGTVSYVVAPVTVRDVLSGSAVTDHTYSPTIGTQLAPQTLTNGTNITLNNALTINTTMAAAASRRADEIIEGIAKSEGNGTILSLPKANEIREPGYQEREIQYDSVEVTGSSKTFDLTGLQADTLYFVYFTIKGARSEPSEIVYLYQFKTLDVIRPRLRLSMSSGTTKVNVRSDMNATADYAMFMMDSLPSKLSEKFYNAVDSSYYTLNGETGVATATASAPSGLSAYLNLPVYEVMKTPEAGGSPYDTYASLSHKESIRQLITGLDTSIPPIYGSLGDDLLENSPKIIDCVETYNIDRNHYLFVAEALSNAATGVMDANFYGFAAIQPIYLLDTSSPVINSIIPGRLVVDYTSESAKAAANQGHYAITGEITLLFDRDLYLYLSENNRQPFTASTIVSSFQSGSSSISTKSGEVGENGKIRKVTLSLTNCWEGATFVATEKLASQYSRPDSKSQLRISVRFDSNSRKVVVTVTPSDPWYPDGSAEFTPDELLLQNATGFTLSPTSDISLSVGSSTTLNATITPDSSYGKIRWQVVSGGGYITTSENTDTSIKVTGNAEGTAKIRATLVDSFGQPILIGGSQVTEERTINVTKSLVQTIVIDTNNSYVTGSGSVYNVTISGTTSVTLRITVGPSTAANKTLYTTRVSGENVFSINGNPFEYAMVQPGGVTHSLQLGRIAPGEGEFIISAMDGSLTSITVHVTVT